MKFSLNMLHPRTFCLFVVVLLHVISISSAAGENTKKCDNIYGTLNGYKDMSSLLTDMRNDVQKQESTSSLTYIICPYTIMDMNVESGTMLEYFRNNTLLKCGENGSSSNNCTFYGGDNVQIYFKMGEDIENVIFQGLRFAGFNHTSGSNVRAYASSTSYASFVDCHWEWNKGISIFDVMTAPIRRKLSFSDEKRNLMGHPAMKINIRDCSFKNNIMLQSIIFGSTGDFTISSTQFESNNVGYFTIGAVFGSVLRLNLNTTFVDNLSKYFNVFVDSDSKLQNNVKVQGGNNKAALCPEGVFIEEDGSYCHTQTGRCDGSCCHFGNNSCDHYDEAQLDSLSTPSAQAETSVTPLPNKKCGMWCITGSILGSFFLYAAVVVAFFYRRYRRKKDVPNLSNAPQNEIS